MTESATLSLGVSIVLYQTKIEEIEVLLRQLLEQGAGMIYLIDNSPLSFDAFGAWKAPERVQINRVGRNLGYGRGHNLPIRESVRQFRYHLISNPDIQLGPGVLKTLYDVMEQRPHIGLAMPEVRGPDGVRHYLCKRAPSPIDYLPSWLAPAAWRAKRRAHFEMRDCSYDEEMHPECLSGCFMFMRSSVLQRLGGFDDRFFMYFEDFDLSRRVRQIADTLYFPRAHVIHEHRRGHRRSLRLLRIFGTSAVRYFNKWGWWERSESRNGSSRCVSGEQ
jgi:GT2 family glycosyltransferase